MKILLDTNILTRSAQPNHPMHQTAADAVRELLRRGDELCIVPQCLYEFWVVCTRPLAVNGMGYTAAQAAAEVTRLRTMFLFLPDGPGIFTEWERLVTTHRVEGKNAHDARFVAAMTVHGVSHFLTFNVADFQRFPAITVLDPAGVTAPPATP